ncbi:hypothetical protein [Ferrovum myxofaciens]|uniref:hypothetical protein n=1 Tax=Ferrovum myxofaciens TaxID=416213 RepID=UPI002357A3A4|nr:hypothetical protein [Ferrovum myxofaciens]MBU6995395.1 hypothetical protein [Ferrovum myxofaciens]
MALLVSVGHLISEIATLVIHPRPTSQRGCLPVAVKPSGQRPTIFVKILAQSTIIFFLVPNTGVGMAKYCLPLNHSESLIQALKYHHDFTTISPTRSNCISTQPAPEPSAPTLFLASCRFSLNTLPGQQLPDTAQGNNFAALDPHGRSSHSLDRRIRAVMF